MAFATHLIRVIEAMLTIENLRVSYGTPRGEVTGISGVSLECGREKLGVVGESGSGKSSIGRAIMGLLPPNAHLAADKMRFKDTDLLACDESALRALRGRRMAMIFQNPLLALNPVMKIGAQIAENYEVHQGFGASASRRHGLNMLRSVHIEDPERMWSAYPNELSGGMAQRAMIAMMLASGPDLLIADEPTSALDVISRQSVLEIIDELVQSRGMGLLFISHDLGLVGKFCDRVVVLKNGELAETVDAVALNSSGHSYTRALLAARPRLVTGVSADIKN